MNCWSITSVNNPKKVGLLFGSPIFILYLCKVKLKQQVMVVFLVLLVMAFGVFGYFDDVNEEMSDEGWNEKYNR